MKSYDLTRNSPVKLLYVFLKASQENLVFDQGHYCNPQLMCLSTFSHNPLPGQSIEIVRRECWFITPGIKNREPFAQGDYLKMFSSLQIRLNWSRKPEQLGVWYWAKKKILPCLLTTILPSLSAFVSASKKLSMIWRGELLLWYNPSSSPAVNPIKSWYN